MAVRIGQYQTQIGTPNTRLSDPGRLRAPTDGGMGEALQDAAAQLNAVNQRRQLRKDELDLMDYERKLSELDTQIAIGDDESPGALRRLGVDAEDVAESTLKTFDERVRTLAPELRTDVARSKAQQMAVTRREDLAKRVTQHEFVQGRAADQQRTEAALTQYGTEALKNADDPMMVKASIARAMGVIQANGRRMGMPPEMIAQEQAIYTSKTLKDVVSSQITRNPVAALDTYKQSADLLVGDDRLQVERAIQPYILDVQGRALGKSFVMGGDATVATGSAAVYDAIAQVESGGRHFDDAGRVIRGPMTATGERAVGKFQIMPATGPEAAELAGLKWDAAAFEKDPDYNAALGRAYLDAQIQRFGGDMTVVAAAYNMGPEAAAKWSAGEPYRTASGKLWTPKGPRDPSAMPTETRNYVQKVSARLGGEVRPVGLKVPGNINLHDRPVVQNEDGSISTVRTISIEMDGDEYLIPTVSDDGRILSNDEAVSLFKETGNHLGVFDSAKSATEYAEKLHNNQAVEYVRPLTESGINALEVSARRRADNIADPKLRASAMNSVGFEIDLMRKQLQEKERVNGARKAEFTDRFSNTVAKLGAGVNVPVSERPTEEQLIAVYGDYEGKIKYDVMQTYAQMAPDIATLSTATVQDANRVVAKYVPDPNSDNFPFENKIYTDVQNAWKEIQERRNADPASFLLKNSQVVSDRYSDLMASRDEVLAATDPAVQQAAFRVMQEKGQAFSDFMIEEQARLGVPPSKRALLPNQFVTQVNEDFIEKMGTGDVTGAVNTLRATVQAFGDGAARAIPQLGKDAGPVARMVLEGLDTRTVESYVAAAAQGDDVLKKSLGNDAWNELQDTVRQQLGPLDATGTTEWPAYFDITMKVAAHKAKLGMDPKQAAVQAAAETINSRYLFAGNNGETNYRVPLYDVEGRAIDAQGVVRSAERLLDTLQPSDISTDDAIPPGISADEYKSYRIRRIQQTARWLTAGDESGLELSFVDDNGRLAQVRDAAGNPLRRTWADFLKVSGETALSDMNTGAYRATIRGTR